MLSSHGCSSPAETADEAEVQPLDLSRDVLDDFDPDTSEPSLAEPSPVLPDLFEQEEETRRLKVKGNLITDKEALELTDKVDGVQVKVEVKTR